MREYEIVKEVFNPCGGEQYPERKEIEELEIADPAAYVREEHRFEKNVEYIEKEADGSLVIEARHESGRRYRYTFSEL